MRNAYLIFALLTLGSVMSNAEGVGTFKSWGNVDVCKVADDGEFADPKLNAKYNEFDTYLSPEYDEVDAKTLANCPKLVSVKSGYGPVYGPFISNLKSCAPGCRPTGFHTYRNDPGSCHNSGRAIDVFGFNCGGGNNSAYTKKFANIVSCMRGKMRVLYHNKSPKKYGQTQAHYDHAHFSIGCTVRGHAYY